MSQQPYNTTTNVLIESLGGAESWFDDDDDKNLLQSDTNIAMWY